MHHEATEWAEQRPTVRERLLNLPDLATLKAGIGSEHEVMTAVAAGQRVVAQKVNLPPENALSDLAHSCRVDLAALGGRRGQRPGR